ncbi:MAG: hypothetical protein QG623_655 [Patescibacteria group bacterium]|nr:hypothetical protein [Patescibacteria group bacterium]
MIKKKDKPANSLSRFQRFSLFFYKNKQFSIFAWLSLLLVGLVTYTGLIQKEGFPSVQIPISVVNAQYFVNDKSRVDSEVSIPIANALKDVEEVKEVSTTSTSNFASVVITYQDDVASDDGSNIVKERLAKQSLPTQAELTFTSIDAAKFANQYNLLVGVFSRSGEKNLTQITRASSDLAKSLKKVEGVEVSESIPQIQSAIDPATGTELQIQQSFDVLGIRNEDSGSLDFVKTANIGIKYKEGQDVLEVSDRINEAISEFSNEPVFAGFEAKVSADFAPTIRSQIASLQRSMLEGFIIIALVSFLLVTWRAGISTALTMVTVLLTTVLILYLLGLSLNVISLFALILSLGLIVDDATIVSEAMDSMKAHSQDRAEVVKEAIGRVARASTAGTLTTIFAFVPMLFITGILGEFIVSIPVTIIISLALSLLFSLSLIPLFATGFLLNEPKKVKKDNIVQRSEKYVSSKLSKLIRYSGTNRRFGALITIGFILLSLLATMVGGSYFAKTGFDIFPKEKDSNELVLNVTYKPGSSLPEAITQADKINQLIKNEAKYIEQVTYSGSGNTQDSSINITLIDLGKREDTSVQIAERIQKDLTKLNSQGILASISSSGAGGPSSDYPLEVRVFSEDPANSQEVITSMRSKLSTAELTTPSGTSFKFSKYLDSDSTNLLQRIDGQKYQSLKLGFSKNSSTEIIEEAKTFINDNFKAEDLGLGKDAIQIDTGLEEGNQDSFKSMLIAFPIMLIAMYILLALQFRSLLQPLFIFLAIPFSFFGVGAGLYYTNNSASFFVMLGFFALIGIAVNNTILITDYANQERKKGLGRVDSIASALQKRFRPLLTTSITSVVALIPLAISDPFWQSLSVTLIFGLLSSTLLVILCFPYYLIASEVIRSGGASIKSKFRRS